MQAIETNEGGMITAAKSNLIVIGIGGCGANALKAATRKYDPEQNPYLSFLGLESNRRVLESCFTPPENSDSGSENLRKWLAATEQFRRIQLGKKGLGAGGDAERGGEMAEEKLEEIEEVLSRFDNAVLIGGGGGGTCGAMPVVAKALQKLDIPTYSILTMPRLREGRQKAIKAERIRDQMLELCPTALVMNEHIPDKKLSFSRIWDEINEGSLFWMLWLLKSLLQEVGDVIDLDGSDWRNATKVGNHSLLGFFDAVKGLEGMERGLLGNPYLNARVLGRAKMVKFWFEGEWPVEDHDRVVECIQKKLTHTDSDADQVEFKWGIREKGVPAGTKTVGFVSFAKDGPDEQSEVAEELKKAQVNIPLEISAAEEKVEVVAVPAALTAHGQNGTNGLSVVPATGGVASAKARFHGYVGGKQTWSEAAPELIKRYESLFSKKETAELWAEAEVIQRELLVATGFKFDIPQRRSFFVAK